MRRHSLRQALARQWMAFAAALSLACAAIALLLLFVLEDSFIDRRLQAAAKRAADPAASASLPAGFQVLPLGALPDDLHSRLAELRPGAIVEFRRADGRYVHAMSTKNAAGQPIVLVYDATEELTVGPGLSGGLGFALALLALSLLCAWALARAFVARASRHARELLRQVLASPDPRHLEALAAREPVREFGELLQLHADAWRAQRAAVERERETLAFLAHELRTPLQSARTSLALLEEVPAHAAARALARLRRALGRLTRASNAILWLGSDAAPVPERIHAATRLAVLVEDLQPLATARQQAIELRVAPGLYWEAPWDVVETLLANLLLNAVQHGGEGVIVLEADDDGLVLCNPPQAADSANGPSGFGLGLRIVQRLAGRIGWSIATTLQPDGMRCEMHWPAGPVDDRNGGPSSP
jgi:signal transduction histidine kinase